MKTAEGQGKGRGKVGKGRERQGGGRGEAGTHTKNCLVWSPVQPSASTGPGRGIAAPRIRAGFCSAVPKSQRTPGETRAREAKGSHGMCVPQAGRKSSLGRQTRSVNFRHESNEHLHKDSFRHREPLMTLQGRLPPD